MTSVLKRLFSRKKSSCSHKMLDEDESSRSRKTEDGRCLKNLFVGLATLTNSAHCSVQVPKSDVSQYDATYAVAKKILTLVGLRFMHNDAPLARLFWNVFYWFEFVNVFVVTWLELINMVLTARGGSFQDAVIIFRMMPCVGYLLLAMARSYKMVYRRAVFEDLVSELRGMWPQGPVDAEEHAVMKAALTQLNRIVQGYYWCNNALLVIFLSPPFVDILKNLLGYETPPMLPFFYWFPFDPLQKGYYEVILFIQSWHGLITIWFMLAGDMLFCVFLCHITIQLDLLSLRIKRLFYVPVDQQLPPGYPLAQSSQEYLKRNSERVASDSFSDWDRRDQRELVDIILRHRALIRLSGEVEEMHSFALLVNFFNSSIIICFCGFCCVIVEKWNEMVYKSFLATALSQTWLLCWYGQRLVEASEGVSEALYNCGWYQAGRRIKSSIFIMLVRTQKEIHVTTYGFSVVNLASYTTIIKTSWSYFTLLLNIYKK